MIYFDNAATTGKKPFSVINAMNCSMKHLSANPGRSGHKLSQDAAFAIYNTRKKFADFFNASGPENICFTANCTTAINYVLKGVLSKNDHVVVSDLEHNAVMRPLYKMGVNFDVAEVSLFNDEETLDNFKSLIKPNTRMIFCTAASNVIGKILPLQKIGALCKEKNILFGVDAAQLAGIIPIDMQKFNIDYLCIAPHKGFYSPMGVGVLIAQKPIKTTVIEGGTGTDSLDFAQPDTMPEMLESGTLNLPAIVATGEGVDFVVSKGESIYLHELKLTQILFKELRKIKKVELYSPFPQKYSFAPVLSFNIKNKSSEDVSIKLNKNGIAVRGGLHCAPQAHKKIGTTDIGTVRFSPSIFNLESEVYKFINIIKKI